MKKDEGSKAITFEKRFYTLKDKHPPFSVAMSVYGKDNPGWFDRALKSIAIEQTIIPDEIIIVVDGPVPDSIKKVIDKYISICKKESCNLKAIYLDQNRGLGNALQLAVKKCSYEIIARMDSDDITVPERFERQLSYMVSHRDTSIVGGQIVEFVGEESRQVGRRIVPLTDQEIKNYMKRRCPFNHMTVMFRKSDILAAGNYRDWFWNEDYYLWIRLSLKGIKFANLCEVLVHVRVGKDMYKRRGGWKYFKSEAKLQRLMLQKKIINPVRFSLNIFERFILQILMPNGIRTIIFQRFARS